MERKRKQIDKLREKIDELSKTIKLLETKAEEELDIKIRTVLGIVRCTAKGHNFVFDKICNEGWHFIPTYQFKCSKCGLTIMKDRSELTVKEKDALKVLGSPVGKK